MRCFVSNGLWSRNARKEERHRLPRHLKLSPAFTRGTSSAHKQRRQSSRKILGPCAKNPPSSAPHTSKRENIPPTQSPRRHPHLLLQRDRTVNPPFFPPQICLSRKSVAVHHTRVSRPTVPPAASLHRAMRLENSCVMRRGLLPRRNSRFYPMKSACRHPAAPSVRPTMPPPVHHPMRMPVHLRIRPPA